MHRTSHDRAATPLILFVVAASLAGCQRDVEDDRMHEMKGWMTAICKCTTKACAAKSPEPKLLSQADSNGKPQYKIDSWHLYENLQFAGETCRNKLK